YLEMRRIYGEEITDASPLIREEFDRRDPFACAHAKPVQVGTMKVRLTNMAEAAGLRTRTQLEKDQKGGSAIQDVPATNGMRRYFSSTLVNHSDIKTEHRWLLEGHNLKGNDASYVHISSNDLLKSYMLAHDSLLIDQSHKLQRQVELLTIEKNKVDQ